eukprot:Polyplicarium_translucidae@DN2551_c0_g1_i1.p1
MQSEQFLRANRPTDPLKAWLVYLLNAISISTANDNASIRRPPRKSRLPHASLSLLLVLQFSTPTPFNQSDIRPRSTKVDRTDTHPIEFYPPDEIMGVPRNRSRPEDGDVGAKRSGSRGSPINCLIAALNSLRDPRYFSSPSTPKEQHDSTVSLAVPPLEGHYFWHEPCFHEWLSCLTSSPVRLEEHLYTVLLYTLIHRNRAFRILCWTVDEAPQRLYKPLIRRVYLLPTVFNEVRGEKPADGAAFPAPPSLTISLLCILTLSRDASLNSRIFGAKIGGIPEWLEYSGSARNDENATIGSLLLLALVRLSSWNFGNAKDGFIFQLISGIMTNVAQHVADLGWVMSDKLVSQFLLLCRKAAGRCRTISTDDDSNQTQALFVLLRGVAVLMCCALSLPHVERNFDVLYAFVRKSPVEDMAALCEALQPHASTFREKRGDDSATSRPVGRNRG